MALMVIQKQIETYPIQMSVVSATEIIAMIGGDQRMVGHLHTTTEGLHVFLRMVIPRLQEARIFHHHNVKQREGRTMETNISWSTDQFGRVIGVRLHDSYLVEFNFSNDKQRSVLYARDESGETIKIEFCGVKDLNIVELCNGTVISDVYAWPINSVPDAWNIPDSVWNTLFTYRYGIDGAKQKVARVVQENPDLLAIQLESSYGGTMAAICNDMNIFVIR